MSTHARTPRFPPEQRRVLLLLPGFGELVLQRLEEAGYASLESLLAQDAPQAIQAAAGLRNRRRAVQRAVAALQGRGVKLASPLDGPDGGQRGPDRWLDAAKAAQSSSDGPSIGGSALTRGADA